MNFAGFKSTLAMAAAIALALGMCAPQGAWAQFGTGDMVIGKGMPLADQTFEVYDASAGTWSNGPGWSVDGSELEYVQSIEFDNSAGVAHNAAGNLLGVNYGSSYTGIGIYNLATDGTANAESVWNIIEASGGTITPGTPPVAPAISDRGGGISVSPNNNYVAWASYDNGYVYVLDYSAGAAPGSGSGATLSGPRVTDKIGGESPLVPSKTQGTAWLDDTTVLAFSAYGDMVKLDVNGIAGGHDFYTDGEWVPTAMTNWSVVSTGLALPSANVQFSDVEYSPTVDPNHIYAATTLRYGSYPNYTYEPHLYAFTYNTTSGAVSLLNDITLSVEVGSVQEPREIALDADGNLLFTNYGGEGNLVVELPNATDVSAGNWIASNVVMFYTAGQYSNYNGFDVALGSSGPVGLLGDYNDDGTIDAADYTVWRDVLAAGGTELTNDPTPGTVDESDYAYWKANFGATSGSGALAAAAVPEPSTLALVALAIGALVLGRGSRGAAANL